MYPFLIRFLLGVRVRRIYIRAGFLENVTAKIELSPQTVFSFENYLQRSQQNTRSAAVAFFYFSSFLSPRSFYFPFPCSFLAKRIFGLILLSAFGLFLSQKTALFVRYVFKN